MTAKEKIQNFSDLAALRESRGITLEEIARTTRIGIRYLRAIERAELEKLPGAVYVSSYIRQYAVAIGLDPVALLDDPQPVETDASKSRTDKRRGALRHLILALRHYWAG